ncbi:hypothetical protein PIB30_029060 [Stylosanthes scabra]|uniref:Uncharacterized protein n=1 Tax=Stylosanthes scabra TaxID=79078 RepID=A0ABU6RBD9_9FABA|nr:hypothetical protein [Stylosanthes scabra]
MRESWARVGWRIGSNQFFRRPRRLPIVITFDPELRLTHVAKVKDNGKRCLDARWRDQGLRVCIELGVQGFESTPSSGFQKLPRTESIHLVAEPIRFHSDFKFNVQNALRIDSPSSESILKIRDLVFKG